MNKRQLDKMIRQIVAEERKKKNYPKMSRRQKLRSVMLEANRRLMEIASDEDFYDTDIKGTADGSAGNFFAAYGAPLKTYQTTVVKHLFADGKNDKGEPASGKLRSLEEDIRCSMLIPSQNVIGSKQSLSNVAFGGGYTKGDGFHMSADDDGGAAYVKGEGYKMFTNPVMAAKCKEGVMIIDGHHRWSQPARASMARVPSSTCRTAHFRHSVLMVNIGGRCGMAPIQVLGSGQKFSGTVRIK